MVEWSRALDVRLSEWCSAVYQWCGFKSRRWKNKNLTGLKSNSNTVWFNFQTYIYIYICCQVLWIVHFSLPLRCSLTFIYIVCKYINEQEIKCWRIHMFKGSGSTVRVMILVFNDTINNISAISWRSVVVVEETGVLC